MLMVFVLAFTLTVINSTKANDGYVEIIIKYGVL
jgi:hypothetical protein